jgi:hypothetical protein
VGPDDGFSSRYVSPPQRLKPMTLGEPLWRPRKGDHTAEARVRAIHGVSLELRYLWDGDLRASQVFKAWGSVLVRLSQSRADCARAGNGVTPERRKGSPSVVCTSVLLGKVLGCVS